MSLEFYRKLSQSFGLMAIGVLFGLIGFAATVEIKDLDLWLHIRTGEYILKHGYVPNVDVLSASMLGQPWINHEWLFQVVLSLIKNAWGMDGLIYMQVAVVVFTFYFLLLLGYHRDRQMAIIPFFFCMLLVYQSRFTIRPDLFSLFFFVLFIYILSLHLNKRWSLYALCAIQVLWTNMHGYFFLGMLFVIIAIAAEFIRRHVKLPWDWNEEGKLTDEEYRRLGLILVMVFASTFLNPQTVKGALYPFTILTQLGGESRIFFENITELQKPFTKDSLFDMWSHWPFRLLIFGSFLSFVFNRRKIDISALIFWVVFLLFSLTALRNMTYFAFAAFLVFMANSSNLKITDILPFRFYEEKFLHVTGIMVRIVAIVMLLNFGGDIAMRGYYDFDKYERKSEYLGIDLRGFPHKAADFLIANNVRGNFFNDFNSGAYLIGRVYPNVMVYMDGRTELRGPKFFENYKKIWSYGDEKRFEEAVRSSHLTGVFINTSTSPAPDDFVNMMIKKKEWVIVYFDYDAIIFLKDIPRNQELIKKFALDLKQWQPLELDTKKLGAATVIPYQNLNRAYSLESLGFDEKALLEADAALKIYPAYSSAYKVRAAIYSRTKDYQKAFENYRWATSFSSQDVQLRAKLAGAYLDLGDYDHAIKEGEKVVEAAPQSAAGYFVLARAYVKNKHYPKAYDILLQAINCDPKALGDILKVGDLYFEEKAFLWAEKVYTFALKKDEKYALSHEKLGNVYKEMGNIDKALSEWQTSLSLKPDNEELKKQIEAVKKEKK